MQLIYKIVPQALWAAAESVGVFKGASIDLTDGFIHFSTAGQMRETAARHFAGQTDLLLVAVDPAPLGEALRYEISRGGEPFPHLYAPLDLKHVVSVEPLPLGVDGRHIFPDGTA